MIVIKTKEKNILSLVFTFTFFLSFIAIFDTYAFANSSWVWLTVSPMTVLPFAVILTLLLETIGIAYANKISNRKRVFSLVTIANILSFLAPYIYRAMRFSPTTGGFSLPSAFEKGPYYIVLTGYLFLTLIIEIPFVYHFLRNECENKKRLLISILSVNVVTTIIVAVMERILCRGQW